MWAGKFERRADDLNERMSARSSSRVHSTRPSKKRSVMSKNVSSGNITSGAQKPQRKKAEWDVGVVCTSIDVCFFTRVVRIHYFTEHHQRSYCIQVVQGDASELSLTIVPILINHIYINNLMKHTELT